MRWPHSKKKWGQFKVGFEFLFQLLGMDGCADGVGMQIGGMDDGRGMQVNAMTAITLCNGILIHHGRPHLNPPPRAGEEANVKWGKQVFCRKTKTRKSNIRYLGTSGNQPWLRFDVFLFKLNPLFISLLLTSATAPVNRF